MKLKFVKYMENDVGYWHDMPLTHSIAGKIYVPTTIVGDFVEVS